MSPKNLYLRFFSLSKNAPDREAGRLCRPAGPDHAALLATLNGAVVGAASYEPSPRAGVAEIAFAVLDDMQGRGGTTPTHFNRVGDTVFAAAFLLRGMRSALGRVGALSHWVASDHFEELGAPEELFHGGFGLLSVGNLRKPRFWALAALARLGGTELAVDISGDGAWGLVEALAARGDDGRIGVLVWNSTLDQGKMHGDPLLERKVRLQVSAQPGAAYTVAHHRVDAAHSNIVAAWDRMRGTAAWPDSRQWQLLREANTLDELTPPQARTAGPGGLELDFALPMPGVSYLELRPASAT